MITIRVKNNSQFSESRKWLEDHSINSDREKTEEQVCGENEESILPVLHLTSLPDIWIGGSSNQLNI